MVELDVLFSIPLIILFGYSLYLGFKLTKKLYGGRFTSVLPPLIGAVALLLLIQVIEIIFEFYPLHEALNFEFSVQMLQLVAGFLFIDVLYKIYQIGFATSGFFRETEKTSVSGTSSKTRRQ